MVYQCDDVNQVYYTSFKTYQGAAIARPIKPTKAGAGGFTTTDPSAIFALPGKTSGTQFRIKVGSKIEEDSIGIRNHTLELMLAPPVAAKPQQILIQTSQTIKLIQPVACRRSDQSLASNDQSRVLPGCV